MQSNSVYYSNLLICFQSKETQQIASRQWTDACIVSLTLQQSLILSMLVKTVENSLLTGRYLQQNQVQCEQPSATTDWGFERTEQRQKKKTETRIQEYFLCKRKVKHC
ncbi:hypothetical protein AMECASPLE_037763 [Ameca splendens]|uniref:Uncharacterized protein n=1 Tax=Ameca splendens TaxID=208324 RepID=A0ABV1A3E1_9TELE